MGKSTKTDKVFFEQIIDKAVSPSDMEGKIEEIEELIMIYSCAIKEVSTKLEILDYEFKIKGKRNPIEYMKSRVKSPKSIMDKLTRKNLKPSIKVARENFNDIAGIRVVCSFVSDIYKVADMLKRQEDITLIEEKDYIKNPKPNGYRSLHMVLEIPIFFSDHVEPIRVEVQIRTIAMDFWASLEHKLYYKKGEGIAIHIKNDLKDCADIIAATDIKMQNIEIEVDKIR
ncbi:GTP pyrophosphokinase [Clostridium estertheticum]|uniref:GTP pyrophosphokinase n=1 Tax=Clostridium estertheticum subsp. estertheticum TaxID=1552 RepID=A0A1J0GJI0_9CLOT|nr:GTP pyrophosphokinase family protein [Clostridium estertheticum]APC41475.1 GTP pyrophosphokinase [Clostridium estertheticum subsp. estertheticum]MBU3172635.1 GTP pyrophosphokinase family protein [Clostridium estertheticum]MBZ9616616.1 GTP pyrophosphokinase family protein [Clostridium estertheticum subsp. laramiense]WAG72339.1 GTP pyrophosphokinase family protein [Clostridium estertheticum]